MVRLKLLILIFILSISFAPKHSFATTLLSDTFTGTTIDTAKWTEFDTGGAGGTTGNVQQNGTLTILGTNTAWGTNGVRTVDTYNRSAIDKSITVTFRPSSCAAVAIGGIGYGDTNINTAGTSSYIVSLNGSSLHLYYFNNGVVVTDVTASGFSCSTSTTYTFRLLVKSAGGASLYINSAVSPNATVGGGTFTNKSFYLQSYSSSLITHDDVVIESYDPTAPTAPQTLSAREGDQSVSLTWSAPASDGGTVITDYLIEYKESSSGSWSTFSDGVSTNLTATVTGLTNGTAYNFRVSAINGVGTGTASSTFTAVPAVVALSDTFTGTTIDTAKWTEFDTGGAGGTTGNVQQNGTLTILGTNTAWGTNGVISRDRYDRSTSDQSIMVSLQPASCSALAIGAIGYGDTAVNNAGAEAYILAVNSSALHLYYVNNGVNVSDTAVSGFSCSTSTTYTIKLLVKYGGGAEVYLNGSSTPNATASGGTFTSASFYLQSYSSSLSTYDDAVINVGASHEYPSQFVGAPMDGAVYLQWSYLAFATDYLIEYKESSSGSWSTFSDGVSTNLTATVTGLTNGTAYDFRISATDGIITYSPTPAISVTPASGGSSPFYGHILSTGQSLSIGYNGGPKLTTTQPYSNKMLTSGNSALTPLVESATGAANSNVETMSSGMANMLSNLSTAPYRSIVSLNGVGATAYAGLKKGTTPYNNGLAQVSAGYNLSFQAGVPYYVAAVTTIHGESDHLAGTPRIDYTNDLVEWQSDYQTDVQAITHQTQTIPLFTDQMASWTGYNDATSVIPLAQLDASIQNPNLIYLVTPKYIFDYSDTAHLTNYSYRRLGEYYGKVMKQVLVDGNPWKPLQPATIRRLGSTITVQFDVPVGPLEFDTTLVDPVTNYGFEYSDDSHSATISSVAITSPDTVTLTLSNTPTGTNQMVSYAYTGIPGSNPGARVSGAPKGNLRDSDTTPALYSASIPGGTIGDTLYNWAVTFSEPVDLDRTNPTISSVTTTKSNGTYGAGEVIELAFTFSKAVSAAGVSVSLSSGGSCSLTVVDSTTGTCTYTVQTGEETNQLIVDSVAGSITDVNGNAMSDFTIGQNLDTTKTIVIDGVPPSLTEVTPIPSTTTDHTPAYSFSTTESGTVTYGGSCSSTTSSASVGTNTVILNTLADGTYTDCQISVTDSYGNTSDPLTITQFIVVTPQQSSGGVVPLFILNSISNTLQPPVQAVKRCTQYMPVRQIVCGRGGNDTAQTKLLQRYLKDYAGYTTQKVTGYCGVQTLANLNAFQEKNRSSILDPLGIKKPTGVAGVATITLINENYCKVVK